MFNLMQGKKNLTVVTWKGGENFGTCLQGYALCEVLKGLGYGVRLLPDLLSRYGVKEYIKYFLSLVGVEQLRTRLICPHDAHYRKRMRWERRAYPVVRPMTRGQEDRLVRKTDCFITGSDQIWNTYHHFMPMQFLHFAKGKKRIAYASSIGTNDIKAEYREQVAEWWKKFAHLGVREQRAVEIIREMTGREDVVQVLDPTLLMTADEWRRFAKDARYEIAIPKRYIFCYLVGANAHYAEQLRRVREVTGIKDIVIVPACENPHFTVDGAVVYKMATAVEFVDLLSRAEFVCTDSFHATAFCLNLQKPFTEFMRFRDDDVQSQNSRVYDILDRYGLTGRIYRAESKDWTGDVDFKPVNLRLAEDRQLSFDFLVSSIER